jgi:hypothetical protein
MPNYICVTCGVQYPESAQPPAHCPICEDERQYVNPNGQAWTTLDELRQKHQNTIEQIEPNLHRIKSEPKVAIGQYAHLVQTPNGNVLWDCITLIDQKTVNAIKALGGIKAIALSHPHYYSTIVEWSRAFDNAPVYVHALDRAWVMRPDQSIVLWTEETRPLLDGTSLIHCGGHFDGSSVLHWRDGAEGRGVLLTGDTIDIVQDTRFVTFMYSYPNQIPLPASKIRGIVRAVEPFEFDRLYEAFGAVTKTDGKASVIKSAERYIRMISE